MTNFEVTNIIESYKTTYNGKFWSEGLSQTQLSANNWGTNETGCETSCNSNTFGNAIQCYGYAFFIAFLVFGTALDYDTVEDAADGSTLAGGWRIYKSNLSSLTLEPGDIIRTGTSTSGHSAIVSSIEGNKFKVTECWGSLGCKLYWGYFNGNSDSSENYISTILNRARYIIKAPKTYTRIKNAGSGQYLTIKDGVATHGGEVIQRTNLNSDKQLWNASNNFIRTKLNENYGIKFNNDSGCTLSNVSGNSLSEPYIEAVGTYYIIKSSNNTSPYYLSADASGSNVYWKQSFDNVAYQKWIIV